MIIMASKNSGAIKNGGGLRVVDYIASDPDSLIGIVDPDSKGPLLLVKNAAY